MRRYDQSARVYDAQYYEEQNAKIVQKVLEKIRQILTNGEEILHVATQKKLINFSPDCAILTNKRFIVYRPTFLGAANFQDYIWRELHDAQLSEGILHAKIYFI